MKPYLIDKNFDLLRLKDSDGNALFTSGSLALYVMADDPELPSTNGIGILNDTISCVASHELNGADEIKLTYPVNGELFDQIQLRNVIVAQADSKRGNQPYRICRISTPMKGKVTVYARHLTYDLAGIVVEPFEAVGIGAALNGLNDHAMTHNPFHFVTTRSTASKFSVDVPTSVWALMGEQRGSLLDVYGGEYSFDGYTIHLENHVGADNGVQVRYGVNLTDLQQDANCDNCYTGVVAYWRNDDEGVVYSPVVGAVGTYGYVKILSVDMSDKFDEKPTVAQLKTAARNYITDNQIGIPKVAWKINFVPLETTVEYANILPLQRVGLGDTVHIKFEKLGVDAISRVNAIEWDTLMERYMSVSLGSVKSSLAKTIAGTNSAVKELPTAAQVQDMSARISKTLTRTILGADGGTVRMIDTDDDGEQDTLFIADNPDPTQAQKVWRWNYEGWAASSNGYRGPFVMGATLQDGLLADFVTAANLVAGTIRSEDGNFLIDLSNGTLTTYKEVTYYASDYTQSDLDRLSDIVGHFVDPTPADYEKYDFYADGDLTTKDVVVCRRLVNGADQTFSWSVRITPNDRGGTLAVGYNGEDVFSVGMSGIRGINATFSSISTQAFHTAGVDASGTIYCNRLFVNGTEIIP